MNSKRCFSFVSGSLALLCACAMARAGTLDATLATLDGEERTVTIVNITATEVKLQQGALPIGEIASIQFSAALASADGKPLIYLRNGDTLRADILSGDESRLKLKIGALGELEIENKFIAAIAFKIKEGPPADKVSTSCAAPRRRKTSC